MQIDIHGRKKTIKLIYDIYIYIYIHMYMYIYDNMIKR